MTEINFGKKKHTKTNESTVSAGTFEDMLKLREKKLPEVEKEINKFFSDYQGQLVVMLRVDEDENGDPEGVRVTALGVGGLQSQVGLIRSIDDVKKNMIDDLIETVKDDPEAMLSVISEVIDLEGMMKQIKARKKDKK